MESMTVAVDLAKSVFRGGGGERDPSHQTGHDLGGGRANHMRDLLASRVNRKPVQSNELSMRG